MATCIKCNALVEEGLNHCTVCGAPMETPVQQSEPIDISDKFSQLNDTADTTTEFTSEDIEKNKLMAVLAYILFFIPLLAAKDSKFARFHTNQGLVLFLAGIISSILLVIPVIGWIIAPILSIVITVLAVIGIINSLNGKAKELPIIGKFKILK